jgi:hypothetical protein
MGDLGNWGGIGDYDNARKAWLESSGKNQKRVKVYIFQGYDKQGNVTKPDETFRKPKWTVRFEYVWLSALKSIDLIKGGYFTVSDLDVYSEFLLRGYTAAYTLVNKVVNDEYAGDIVEWNGKLWEVADQLEPVTWGVAANQVWYHTILRRTNRSGLGIEIGP